MKRLNKKEYDNTFNAPMRAVDKDANPPIDFWDYFEKIPVDHFEGHDCSAGLVDDAWTDSTGKYQHVLINSENKNIFMVLVIDLSANLVYGHRLLNLNQEYGIKSN